jgi:hypothetical protein
LGLGELYQNSVSDDIISRQYLPAMRFLEEVNAYLEQLNAAKCHKDPFLVAFTLTTDGFLPTQSHSAEGFVLPKRTSLPFLTAEVTCPSGGRSARE